MCIYIYIYNHVIFRDELPKMITNVCHLIDHPPLSQAHVAAWDELPKMTTIVCHLIDHLPLSQAHLSMLPPLVSKAPFSINKWYYQGNFSTSALFFRAYER
jgi:hypothetical protein